MENITPYNEFLNENQMRIPFLDLEVAKRETEAHIKPFLKLQKLLQPYFRLALIF